MCLPLTVSSSSSMPRWPPMDSGSSTPMQFLVHEQTSGAAVLSFLTHLEGDTLIFYDVLPVSVYFINSKNFESTLKDLLFFK